MKYYHICLSGKGEIMFRTDNDYNRAINCMALAAYKTNSKILAYAFMSTHIHVCIKTENPYKVITKYRYAYTRYFNAKYFRYGKLGMRHPFIIELEGLYHILAAICYVLRNPVHHGVCETPFGYSYSSINSYFRKALGKGAVPKEMTLSSKLFYRYLPYKAPRPEKYRMNRNGAFIQQDFTATQEVEHLFVTGRAFCYYMNRISSEEWLREQEKDMNKKESITIKTIEAGIKDNSLSEMLKNEHGKSDYHKISDIELCTLIDNKIPAGSSIYTLDYSEKERIYQQLTEMRKFDSKQIQRCLNMRSIHDINQNRERHMSHTAKQ